MRSESESSPPTRPYEAGPEHVEQYVSLVGDENWLNHDENRTHDTRVRSIVAAADQQELASLIEAERQRYEAILQCDYLEVPFELRDAELTRIEHRLADLGGDL